MKVCTWADPNLSGAMHRVALALAAHVPEGVTVTPRADDADLVIVHTIGTDVWPVIARLRERGQRYAMMQYCMRSTQEPNTAGWLDYWRGASCVWSYYDLDALIVEDGYRESECPWCGEDLPHVGLGTGATDYPRCWYYAPLGADPDIFYPLIVVGDRFGILTSGYVAESECIAECTQAARRAGRMVFHLGPSLACHGPHVTARLGIRDDELQQAYCQSDFVAGMRRCEGFEMPAVEGLFCGARPIMLDRPHYRAWFNEFAEFVPEVDAETLIEYITDILISGGERGPVTDAEIDAAHKRFNWKTLVTEFWERALGGAA